MKRNKIFFAAISCFVLSLTTSCTDLLEVSSNSMMSDDVVFKNPESAEQAVAAIYNILSENNSYRNRLWLQMGINNDIEYRPGYSSGAVVANTKADDAIALFNVTPSLADGYNQADAANPWSRIYQGIERANLAIAGIRKYGNPAAGNLMGHLLGEALTMRAFYYYDLTKWWGDVPTRFEPVNINNIYIGKTDRAKIYDQLVADLQEASNLMYSADQATQTATTKRINKDAARGLLARIALQAAGKAMLPVAGTSESTIDYLNPESRRTELYTIAREATRAIIADGKYHLAGSFKDIFVQQCRDSITNGREAIWQLPYVLQTRGRMVYNLGLPRDADGVHTKVTIGGQFRIMPNFYYDFDANDSRRDITVVPYKVAKSSVDSKMEQTLSGGVNGFNLGKWRAEWTKYPIAGTDDGISPIVLRYADVLLMFAEADLMLNGNEGQNYFNQVRRRAFNQPINSTSPYDLPLTLENLKKERAFELCGENLRKYDLIRWGELKSAMDAAKTKLRNLRDAAGEYATVPQTIYYKYVVDNTITVGERVLVIYGLQRGETDDKTVTDPTGGWTKKTWTNGLTGTEAVLSDVFIDNLYQGDPDKRQLLPIMNQIMTSSNGMLKNDYGYPSIGN